MVRATWTVLVCVSVAAAAQNSPFILSSAGGALTVAPGSIVSLYGINLPTDPVQAAPDKDGLLPTNLAGYTVEMDGLLASITYIGPTQVNFVIPPGAGSGKNLVSLQFGGQEVASGTANVIPVAPAIFTEILSGREVGAILNAVTFRGGPFDPETASIVGCDTRTRLAVFATGLALASQVRMRDIQVQAQDATGNTWQLALDSALPSSFQGLDQLNAILPFGMPAGTYRLWIVENGVESNHVQFDMLARSSPTTDGACVARVNIARVPGQTGEQFTGTVSLAYPAQPGGVTVALQGGDASIPAPGSVFIAEGQVSAMFPFALSAPHTFSPIAVTASLNGVNVTGVFNEGAPCVNRVWLSTPGIVGGQSLSGTVAVTDPAPAGGTKVSFLSSSPTVDVSPSVTIPEGSMTAPFTISTAQAFIQDRTTIVAQGSCGGSAVNLNVVVYPCIASIAVSTGSVSGGGSLTGTLTMTAPVLAGGITVNLKSTDPNLQVPATVLVPEGQSSATFQVTSTAGATVVGYVTAYINCGSASAMVKVNP